MEDVKFLLLTRYHTLRLKNSRKIGFFWNDGAVFLLLLIVFLSGFWIDAIQGISDDYYYGIFVNKVQFISRSHEDYNIATFRVYKFQKSIVTPLLNAHAKDTSSKNFSDSDQIFLTTMKLDISNSRWIYSYVRLFLEMVPILNQSVPIILAFILKMVKDDSKVVSIPNGWKTVLPVGVCMFIMTVALVIYYLLASEIINKFCWNMKSALKDPHNVSCGNVLYALRPILKDRKMLTYDASLNLFFKGALITIVLWLMAFTLMFVRFILAVDFELVLVTVECFQYPPSNLDLLTDISRKSMRDSSGFLTAEVSDESSVPSLRTIKFR